MNAELANLAKEIGRIAQSQQDNVEWDKVAKFSEIVLIFDSPELESLNYHQFQNVVEIYAIAHSQRDDADWNAVQLFAKMMLQIDRVMVEARLHGLGANETDPWDTALDAILWSASGQSSEEDLDKALSWALVDETA